MINIDIMQDASEIVHYDNQKLPLYIRRGILSSYPDMRALCHWHEDIELICILDGEMYYDINGKKILLKQGDSLFVNTRQMHYGYSNHHMECSFICILFHPALLMNSPFISEKYIEPVINSDLEYLQFSTDSTDGNHLLSLIKQMIQMKENADTTQSFELNIMSTLFSVWNAIYDTCKKMELLILDTPKQPDLLVQKKMVSYIYQKYSEAISLEDIATAGNVSRSKCCMIFKKYLNQSPIDFLNAYRLEVTCHLLLNTDEKVSDIALSCGFNHISYYSKIFDNKYGCTPSEYRKQRPAKG